MEANEPTSRPGIGVDIYFMVPQNDVTRLADP